MELADSLGFPREFLISTLPGGKNEPRKKKRGAPFGNQNARKHGRYSKFLTPDRIKKLDQAVKMDDLSHEITIHRLQLDSLLTDSKASADEVWKIGSLLSRLINTQRRHFDPS